MGNGSIEYLNLTWYSSGYNETRYINKHNKETNDDKGKLFSTISNLKTDSFWLAWPKLDQHTMGNLLTRGIKYHKEKQTQNLKLPWKITKLGI